MLLLLLTWNKRVTSQKFPVLQGIICLDVPQFEMKGVLLWDLYTQADNNGV